MSSREQRRIRHRIRQSRQQHNTRAHQPATRRKNGIMNLSMTLLLAAMCMMSAMRGAASSQSSTAGAVAQAHYEKLPPQMTVLGNEPTDCPIRIFSSVSNGVER